MIKSPFCGLVFNVFLIPFYQNFLDGAFILMFTACLLAVCLCWVLIRFLAAKLNFFILAQFFFLKFASTKKYFTCCLFNIFDLKFAAIDCQSMCILLRSFTRIEGVRQVLWYILLSIWVLITPPLSALGSPSSHSVTVRRWFMPLSFSVYLRDVLSELVFLPVYLLSTLSSHYFSLPSLTSTVI